MKNKDGSLSSCRSWGENTTCLKPNQHCLGRVIPGMAVVGFRFISTIMLCFYLFYWFLVVVCCLLFVVCCGHQGPQDCFAESDCLHTCSVLVFILISLLPSENNLYNLYMGPSLNLMFKNHTLAPF